jgi:hypothetical protein
VLGGVEVSDLAAQLLGLAQGGFFQLRGNLLAVLGEILVGDAVGPEVVPQSLGVRDAAQGAAEKESVKAAEDTTDDGSELG